jgi:predicted dehydrogenase
MANKDEAKFSRRRFVPGAAAAFTSVTIVPRRVLGGPRYKSPSEKLNIAGVGVGGMGANYLRGCESENIVALCDVDDVYAAPTFQKYPQAKTYRDFRRMLDKEKSIDAVIIGTPDHVHSVVAVAAMQLGKHVYCAKPLTRTIYETRAVAKTARETKVATQMSVQSCASDAACSTAEWVWSGAIGSVREVHVWSDRPIWPQAVQRPQDTPSVPAGLDWDLWLGPAPRRPYHPAYHPWIWRGWWDFGTGAIGDMACHTLHVIIRALKLGYPASVHATSAAVCRGYRGRKREGKPKKVAFPESAPDASMITWDFPARGAEPPVRVTWFDGGLKPPRPPALEAERSLGKAGILFIGDKGTILSGFSGGPSLLPEKANQAFQPPEKTTPRSIGHYREWIEAAKGGKPANCRFEFGSLLTEIALLGNLAVRTGELLYWDPASMRVTNNEEANPYVREPFRSGWSL